MAKDTTYVVAGMDNESTRVNSIKATYPTQDEACQEAESLAKASPGHIYTVYQAVADFQAGEIPVNRTEYRQRTKKAGEAE